MYLKFEISCVTPSLIRLSAVVASVKASMENDGGFGFGENGGGLDTKGGGESDSLGMPWSNIRTSCIAFTSCVGEYSSDPEVLDVDLGLRGRSTPANGVASNPVKNLEYNLGACRSSIAISGDPRTSMTR